MLKEKCIYVKRDLYICTRKQYTMTASIVGAALATALGTCRDLHICQKRPTYMSKEKSMYVKRDLYIYAQDNNTQ